MKVVNNSRGEYSDVINSHYSLEELSEDSDSVLFLGYDTSKCVDTKSSHANYANRIYLNLESPCSFCSVSSFEGESRYFTHTYTICPYTAKWLTERSNIKATPIAFPYKSLCFDEVPVNDKSIASMYMGTIMCQQHEEVLDVIRRRTHAISSLYPHPKLTHCKISSHEKWMLLGKAKSNVIINMCPISSSHIAWILQNDLSDHGAFDNIYSGFIPQFKPRTIESMVCKAVCLVKKDPWNVIENWFEPDKHFLYWETYEELDNLIENIDSNYEDYSDIINNAYEEVKKYEILNIFERIKGDVGE